MLSGVVARAIVSSVRSADTEDAFSECVARQRAASSLTLAEVSIQLANGG